MDGEYGYFAALPVVILFCAFYAFLAFVLLARKDGSVGRFLAKR